ncbi:ABC transporter substrate-binding protein [Salinirubellus sp. GCM10025818]|uniref:ABC transporter substrate-binding protein n=1 Tax=Salinirubellus TaxID=2162630 RepID=UPI0030D1DEDF
MTDEDSGTPDGPTRRDYLRYGGIVAGGALLAGCTGDGGSGSTPEPTGSDPGTPTPTKSATATGTATGADVSTEASGDGSYSVTMAPAGEVTFESVPERVLVYSLLYADMAVAYGHGDAVNSLGFDAEGGGSTLDAYYARLDGVSFDREGLTQLNTGSGSIRVEKELLYELDSDLHLMDPCLMASFDGWGMADVEEVRENVAPWFGNVYSRRHGQPPEPCRDDYEYYTLWEIAERVSRVFGRPARYEALASVHDGLLSTIESDLPPEGERPEVGSVIYMDETFYPAKIDAPGFATAHVRPLGAPDAFVGEDVTYETSYDFETLLEIDPDVLLHRYGVSSYYDVAEIRRALEDHPVGSQLSAVRNGRVYPSGHPVQGPLMNPFQLEMTAKQLYPERFGEWPTYTGGPYPEIPEAERLFDREEVASIVNEGV